MRIGEFIPGTIFKYHDYIYFVEKTEYNTAQEKLGILYICLTGGREGYAKINAEIAGDCIKIK